MSQTINLNNKIFDAQDGETILEAAIRNKVETPYSCMSGSCGTCKTKVVEGQYKEDILSRSGLLPDERKAGYILSCMSVPLTNMKVIVEN